MGVGWLTHIFFAFTTNKGRSASAVAREMLIAATFLVPVVGTYRLVVGAELDENSTFIAKPIFLYLGIKMNELVFESIPESIIQILGLLNASSGDIQTIQIVGVLSSIVSGAFIMTGEEQSDKLRRRMY